MRRARNAAADARLSSAAPLFAALGDRTRLRLVARLCDDGPMSIATLSAGLPITRQAVTKHLRVMERAGLVRGAQSGRESIWHIEHSCLTEARKHLDAIAAQWDAALHRLKLYVER